MEGVRGMEDALRAGVSPTICLFNRALLKRTPRGIELWRSISGMAAIVITGSGSQGKTQEASERALEAAAGTLHPQGIVAAFAIPRWPVPAPVAKGVALALICDNVQDPGNLGTILRTAEAAGVNAVWLSPDCVDPFNPKVVRAGMGAHFRLPIYSDNDWQQIGTALMALGVTDGHIYATEAEAKTLYYSCDWRSPTALIVSNEAHGLSRAAREFLQENGGGTVSIPMSGRTESLNAAVAAAVILFEAARQRRLEG
ncbi:MAG: RNA methyltransferase [Chloroflexota bacterium]|nr:RNA methyltransferase [Chloroflexota bacterium]